MRRRLGTQIKEEGLTPDEWSYNGAMDACAKAHQWEEALGLYEDMQRAHIAPSTVTYTTLINACGRAGEHGPRVIQPFYFKPSIVVTLLALTVRFAQCKSKRLAFTEHLSRLLHPRRWMGASNAVV